MFGGCGAVASSLSSGSSVASFPHTNPPVVPGELPDVLADREMMELALRQLLDNAVKYSPPDSPIAISAAAVDGQVAIRIRDFGKGVPDAESARIFDKF